MTPFDLLKDEAKLAWAVGLFEGEGSIVPLKKRNDGSRRWRLSVKSTDHDVVVRLQAVLGGLVHGPYDGTNGQRGKLAHYKPAWTWELARQAEVEETLARVVPFLCERRAERAHEALEEIRVWRLSKQF